ERETRWRPEARLLLCRDPSRAQRDVLFHARVAAEERCDLWPRAASREPYLMLLGPEERASFRAIPGYREVSVHRYLPATALFPVVVVALASRPGGMNLAAVLLMLLGTQWYILFNVIAGAMAIPADMREVGRVFRFRRRERWRFVLLPGIFPSLVTGLVTAAGGAWNASIVAEYFHFGGRILSTLGAGSTIAHATDAGQFGVLLGATMSMAGTVVVFNRFVWRRLYEIAEARFTLES
ncbi:MAG TPA: ABC transporter permease subunit, partial [Vicinamibacteria bacterium]